MAGSRRCGAPGLRLTRPASPSWQSRARPRPRPTAPSRPSCSSASWSGRRQVPQGRQRPALSGVHRHRKDVEMLGKLSWSAIPINEPLPLISTAVVAVIILIALGIVIVKGWWPYLWREWLTSVDHKRIGVMYVTLGLVMLLRGFADALMMRSQQALAIGTAQGYLPPEHYNQIFSAHGTIMIFFVAMPLVIGLMNFAVPLQLGVRDVAFPVLNSVSFWLTAAGALLVNVSLVIG